MKDTDATPGDNKPKEPEKEVKVDPAAERKAKILEIARAQGLPITEDLATASEKELEKLEDLLKAVKLVAQGAEDKAELFKVALGALEGAKIVGDSGNLFNEHVVNAARKSYNNFLEIKNKKEPIPTNWDICKGLVQLAADTFFALKTFRQEAHKKYPGLMALEATLASASVATAAPAVAAAVGALYAACKGISTVLTFAGYKDNTVELVKGGKELKAKAEEAQKDKEVVEKDQGGVTIESLADAFKVFEEKGIMAAIAAIPLKPETLEKVAARFEGMTGQTEEASKKFVEALGVAMADIPKSSGDVIDFIKTLTPEGVDLGAKGKAHLATLTTKLIAIEEGTAGVKRLADTAMAFEKLAADLKKDGIELPAPITKITDKMVAVRESITPATDNAAEAMGCGKAILVALDKVASTMQPSNPQSRSPA